jgi:DNA mismatch endonuclease (patch repair protein)
MKRVRQKNTTPELVVRRFLHAQGFRYRLHPRELAGRPDIVLPKYKTVVFVHGCFWHGHDCRHGRVESRTNSEYWTRKIADNVRRDRSKENQLSELGWHVIVVWECDSKSEDELRRLTTIIRGAQESP